MSEDSSNVKLVSYTPSEPISPPSPPPYNGM